MRLLSLEVAGFRGFATERVFDLDADAVVVIGANGNGKTSLFDAILWGMSGRVPRLGSSDSLLVCRFSETGQARVVLSLRGTGGPSPVTVTRIFDGKETRVSVRTPERVLVGPEAEGYLIQLAWSGAATAASPAESLAGVLTGSVYLQQDRVRQFIDSVTEHERFAAVSELVGAGGVTELQAELEKGKAAWTKTTNIRAAELRPLHSQLSTMESRLAELQARQLPGESGVDEAVWSEWWGQLKALGLQVSPVTTASREAGGAIDAAIKELEAVRRAAQRRQQLLEAVDRDLGGMAENASPMLTLLREKVAARKEQVELTRVKVAAEQARATEVRRLQADLTEKSEQLRALAALALRHLGEKCPVCDQQYDIEGTRRRLKAVATAGGPASAPASSDGWPELLAVLALEERALSAADLELRSAEQATRDREAAELVIEKRLAELNLAHATASDRASVIRAAAAATLREVERLAEAQRAGEIFALKLSRTGDQTTIQEMLREIATTKKKVQEEDRDLAGRTATGEDAQRVIEALREAASRVVTERIKEIEPLLGDLYSRIDMHPAFRVVKFLASVMRGRGQLSTVVSDPLSDVECDSPGVVLSSGQMNALAVCMFVALNLSVARPALEAAILDDPLQSLDDINLLGLIDLLRRTKDQRQLCVSTHDIRFGNLLARKLRPRSSQQRTVVIELDGWSRSGPTVTVHDVKCDPAAIRLVAS